MLIQQFLEHLMFLAFSAASLTSTQIASINQAAYQAMFDAMLNLLLEKQALMDLDSLKKIL